MKQSTILIAASLFVLMLLPNAHSAQQPPKLEALASSASKGGATQPSKQEALVAVERGMTRAAALGVSACTLCYSCGADWPAFGGAIPTRTGARPYERGDACSGDLTPRADTLPYLCCKDVP